MTTPHLWRLERFLDVYDIWASEQGPTPELRHAVALWIFSRMEDPYQGVERQADIAPNLWWGTVPGTLHGDGWYVVVCSYWIVEETHTVRCDSFATLGLPL